MCLLCRSSCRLRCLRFSSSAELDYDGSEGVFRPFWPFFALLRVVLELSAQFLEPPTVKSSLPSRAPIAQLDCRELWTYILLEGTLRNNNQQPTTNNQQPTTNNQQPTTTTTTPGLLLVTFVWLVRSLRLVSVSFLVLLGRLGIV